MEDHIVEEVRAIKERLAREQNFEVSAIFEELRKRQSSMGSRLVRMKAKRVTRAVEPPNLKTVETDTQYK